MGRRAVYYLKTSQILDVLDQHGWTQSRLARRLGLCRSYVSQVVHAQRPLSPSVRARLRTCAIFRDVADEQLWTRTPVESSASPSPPPSSTAPAHKEPEPS